MRVFFILFVTIAIAVGVLWLLPSRHRSEPITAEKPYPVEPVRRDIRDVTPDNTLPGPKIANEQVTRLPGVIPPARESLPPRPLIWRKPIVRAAGILVSADTILHIRGIKPLALDAICKTKEGENWPCGRFARTAMRGLIQGRAIECDPAEGLTSPILANCRVGNRDIGLWLVKQGWAKDADGGFGEHMDMAKKAEIGMWRVTLP